MAAIPSQKNLPDTPPSRQSTSVKFDHRVDRAEDIAAAVKNETMNAFTAVHMDDLMKKLLRSNSVDTKAILDELQTAGLYVNGKWADLPQKKEKNNKKFNEEDLYDGWVKIASKVDNIIREKHSSSAHGIRGKWVDCNHKIPKSQTPAAPSLRPDIAFVAVTAEKESLKNCAGSLHEGETRRRTRSQQRNADNQDANSADNLKQEGVILQLWWLQMIGFGEFKVKKEDKESAFTQLCTYVKQALREQLDRRFFIGFTLCYDDLNVYLFDRSGVVGVENSINIHKNPEQLIELIACYTVLKAEELGFDPTMKVFSKNVGSPRSSWTMPLPKLEDKPDLYECQWVIKIAGDEYITIRTLSLVNAEMLCGRGTIVWEVVLYKDYVQGNKDAEVFVLKQSWQRTPGSDSHTDLSIIPFESFAHTRADIAGTRIQKAVYVESEHGEMISTMKWIRAGLEGTLRHVSWLSGGDADDKQLDIHSSTDLPVSSIHTSQSSHPSGSNHVSGTSEGRKRSRTEMLDPGEREPFLHQGSLSVRDPNFEERAKPVDRKQTRILMKTRGWSLKHFRNLVELLEVFRDAIDDHKQFYYRGVLHRDISAGNIVILNPPKDDKIGRLIDLDHAKMNKDNKRVEETRPLFKGNFPENVLQSKVNAIKNDLAEGDIVREKEPVFVDESIAIAAFKAVGQDSITYLRTIVERFDITSSEQKPIKPSDLHWNLPVEAPPSFESYSAGDGVRTGTLPFMSHKIVGETPEVHDAIHDIESFFWVMVYIALTRAGPGDRNSDSPHTVLDSYFNDKHPHALASVKGQIFSTKDKAAKTAMDKLLKHFHSYFKNLKPFITKWQKVIQTAYQFEAYELRTIHEYTKALIEEAIAEIGINPSPELTQKEDDRRAAYNRDTQNAIQQNIPVPTQQVTPEKAPRQATQPEEPESPTRIPKPKKLKGGKP